MLNRFNYPRRSILLITVLFLIGCKRQEIEYYEIAKEETRIEQEVRDLSRSTDRDMAEMDLSSEAVGRAANPNWTIPEGWMPGKASAMRRGSFTVTSPEGLSVDISITTFPGDLGGELMNINRWRRQLGLGPIAADQIEAQVMTQIINNMSYRIVDFSMEKPRPDDNHPQRTIVATLTHNDNSWFFKMTGDAPLVALQEETYMVFLTSVRF